MLLFWFSPLVSLMKDQVKCLKEKGINASSIGEKDDVDSLNKILRGEINIVFSSPEAVLANDRWREIVCSPVYQQNVIAVAVDEAHCITHW